MRLFCHIHGLTDIFLPLLVQGTVVVDNRCSQYYSVLREIALIAKTRPVTAEEIDNILKKYQ